MENKLAFYAWYPSAFRSDTQHLTQDERHAYRDLLDEIFVAHQDTCSLPDDDEYLARVVGRSLDAWKDIRKRLIDGANPSFRKGRGYIYSPRLSQEIKKARDKSAQNSTAAHSRWNADALRMERGRNAIKNKNKIENKKEEKKEDKKKESNEKRSNKFGQLTADDVLKRGKLHTLPKGSAK